MSKRYFVDQYTEKWFKLRRGMPTASEFGRIITPGGKPSAQAPEYRARLVAERLLDETFGDRATGKSFWTEHGHTTEAEAYESFKQTSLLNIKPIGFITTDDERAGCSPDFLVSGVNEAGEIKCPAPWTHMSYLLDGPGDAYKPQLQGQFLIGEFDRIHFYSYHPRMPPAHYIMLPNIDYLEQLEKLLDKFCIQLEKDTERAEKFGDYHILDEIARAAAEAQRDTPWHH